MSDFELSAAEFRALYDRVKHMSRWGPADRRGALNNVSPAQVVLAAPAKSQVAPDNPDPVVHQMTHPGPARLPLPDSHSSWTGWR
jgi:hypothetical protein